MSSWTEIPAAGLEMYTSSEGEPQLLLEKHGFSGAITTGHLPELAGGSLFAAGQSLGSNPTEMQQRVDPPQVGG